MRIGWLADRAAVLGGAELTQAEHRQAAPGDVAIIDCLPGNVDPGCDRYVLENCLQYTLEDFEAIGDKPAVKYWHDVGPHLLPEVREWLGDHTTHVCCSPVQADYMGIKGRCIPPPIDLDRFREAASHVNGDRQDTCSVGSWRNYGKAAHRVAEWARGPGFVMVPGGEVDFYGSGPFAPSGSVEVAYNAMPALLARYERFVFLPTVIEPFGRLVAEAWAAGCEVVTNNLVGAKWWIENDPEALDTAASEFWKVVLA